MLCWGFACTQSECWICCHGCNTSHQYMPVAAQHITPTHAGERPWLQHITPTHAGGRRSWLQDITPTHAGGRRYSTTRVGDRPEKDMWPYVSSLYSIDSTSTGIASLYFQRYSVFGWHTDTRNPCGIVGMRQVVVSSSLFVPHYSHQ